MLMGGGADFDKNSDGSDRSRPGSQTTQTPKTIWSVMLAKTDTRNPTADPIAVSRPGRLDFLDVARGIAAALVLIEHGVMPHIPGYEAKSYVYGSLGRMGVILFLLVSGFIIPVSLEKSGSNGRFWVRRIGRLFPAYWLAVLLAYGWAQTGYDPTPIPLDHPGAWLLNLTMLQGFFNVPHAWGVFWTLQLELVIYFACSLLFVLRLTNRWALLIWAYLILYAIAGLAKPVFSDGVFGIGGNRFLYLTPLMGVVAQKRVTGEFSARKTYAMLAVQVLSLVAVWWASHYAKPEKMTSACVEEFLLRWGVPYLIMFALVELRDCRMPRIGCWFGRISYSVYLMHPLVLLCLARFALDPIVSVALFFAATIGLAQLSYWLLELPGIRLSRTLENRWFGPMPGKKA